MDFCNRGWKSLQLKEFKNLLDASHRGIEQSHSTVEVKTSLGWTEEEEQKLFEMVTSGIPLKICARTLGKTNNQVYGKIWRKGWRKNKEDLAFKALRKKFSKKLKEKNKKPIPTFPVVFDQIGAPEPKNKNLMSLEDNDCRYIVDDKTNSFCANQIVQGTSYCEYHLSKCYQTTKKLKKILEDTEKDLEVFNEV